MLRNDPKRCPNCRILARLKREGKDASTSTEITCANCFELTRVPFHPYESKPVYCARCYHHPDLRKQDDFKMTTEDEDKVLQQAAKLEELQDFRLAERCFQDAITSSIESRDLERISVTYKLFASFLRRQERNLEADFMDQIIAIVTRTDEQ